VSASVRGAYPRSVLELRDADGVLRPLPVSGVWWDVAHPDAFAVEQQAQSKLLSLAPRDSDAGGRCGDENTS
jgi:hypothetical protein